MEFWSCYITTLKYLLHKIKASKAHTVPKYECKNRKKKSQLPSIITR